jgi:two-component system response regulator MprA
MPKILLVDDDADFRAILRRSLADQGYEVVTAPDGVRGLQAVMNVPPDLILLDLAMPYRDGMETLRLIRAVQPDVAIIILTGLMNEAEHAEATRWGVTEVMLKPISMKGLLETIAERLEKRHGSA